MGSAAYLTVVKKSGTSTAFTQESTTTTDDKTYTIGDTTKSVWDRSVAPTVERSTDGGATWTTVSASEYVVDYLFGRIIFNVAQAAGTLVRVSGNYLPLAVVGNAYQHSIDWTHEILDATDFQVAQANGGYRGDKLYGLADVSVTLGLWGPDTNFKALRDGRSPVLVEIQPAGSGETFRAWMVVESDAKSGDVGGLEEDQITLQLDGDGEYKAYAWG